MSREADTCSCRKSIVPPSDAYLIDLIVDQVKLALGARSGSPPREMELRNGVPLIPLGVSNRHIHLTRETFH